MGMATQLPPIDSPRPANVSSPARPGANSAPGSNSSGQPMRYVHPDIVRKREANQKLLQARKQRAMAIVHEREAVKIRRRAQARQARRDAAKRRTAAAITVQTARRGMLARQELAFKVRARWRARRQLAVARLQGVWRGVSVRIALQAAADDNLELLKARQLALIDHNQRWLERNIGKRREALRACEADEQAHVPVTPPMPPAPDAPVWCGFVSHADWSPRSPFISYAQVDSAAPICVAITALSANTPFWRSGARHGQSHAGSALPKPPPPLHASKPPPPIDVAQRAPAVDATGNAPQPPKAPRPAPSGQPGVPLPSRPMHVKHRRSVPKTTAE